MRIGIDTSNLRSGGSVVHLSELLKAARPGEHGVERVFVWGGRDILSRLPGRDWLECVREQSLERPLPARVWWQQTRLSVLAEKADCDLLFVPGGTYLGGFRPFVTMSRNMLPFEFSQVRLYGASAILLKFLLLRLGQAKTIRDADGTIFLDDYARARIHAKIDRPKGADAIIPHGVSEQFRATPRAQKGLSAYSDAAPFRLLYVSALDAYKNQWYVAEAVSELVRRGLPVTLEMVGPARPSSLRRLRRVVRRLNAERYVHYHGSVPHDELPAVCSRADVFVFASSCENLPNALLEAMAAGLPIACSDRGPMPGILGEGGVYFDPQDATGMADVLHRFIASPADREARAAAAYQLARRYTWERCADETFSFLKRVARP